MNVLVRTDVSEQIGTGHFMRCLTLAEALKQRGAQVCFVSRGLPGYLGEILAAKGMALTALPGGSSQAAADNLIHSHWLGASQTDDAQAAIEALPGKPWDWLIVDHYALDARWETAMRIVARRIMAVDDLADRCHDCDVLLDQNFYADMQTRYDGKVQAHCRLLLGPRYALLREEFRILRARIKLRTGPVKRILVFLGGVDAGNYTGLTLETLTGLAVKELQVEVVIGAQHPYRAAIAAACAAQGYVCHVQTARMAELMAAADLAIGAGGSATWERCCLGLPAVLVALADNQINIAKGLDSLGAAVYLGTSAEVDEQTMQSAILNIVGNDDHFRRLSGKAFSLVDGLGIERVCQVMEG